MDADARGLVERTPIDPLGAEWVREPPTERDYRHDAVIAVILAVGTSVSFVLYSITGLIGHPANPWVGVAWILALNGSIAFRRRWPALVAVSVAGIFIVGAQWLSIPEQLFGNIDLFLALYTLGAWGTDRLRSMLVRLAIIVGMFLWLFIALFLAATQPESLSGLSRAGTLSPFAAYGLIQVITNLLYFGAAYYFGNAAYQSARQRAAFQERTRELVQERERSAAQAVTLERVRIARELHDVVAHHVSVMGVQAGAARKILERDPDRAAASLSAIEANARDAVEELHTMLGTLRDDGNPDGDMHAPAESAHLGPSTRGVEQLPELVTTTRASGVPVALTIVGAQRPLPAVIGLSVYRVAQESLTNVRKHAGSGATVDMRLRYLATSIEFEVSDNGRATPGRRGQQDRGGGGLGQIGMWERVTAVGGDIEMGPKARGGYVVRARFPAADARIPTDSSE